VNINGSTVLTGIIGKPVRHSLSPVFQNAAFEYAGLNWVYLAFEVASERLQDAISGLAACNCRGLNVTMPYKQAVLPFLDELDETAAHAGAVNTIEFKNGKLIGHNTDGTGFIKSLERDAGFTAAGKKALIIGAGGAARSIAMALGREGAASIKVLNRNKSKAEKLIGLIGAYFPACEIKIGGLEEADIAGYDLIVNATSVGMENNPGLPLAAEGITPDQIVYDIIYWPLETEFLRAADEKGACTINGLRMLLFQGAESFSIWTGKPAPVDLMAAALKQQ
jgi:shikimate dehydrogenase